MNRLLISVFLLSVVSSTQATEAEQLHANEWLLPKKATTLIQMPAVSNSMKKLQTNSSAILTLKYPGGDEGTLWVNELRSWLITLGLPSKRIELIPGSSISTVIEFEVISAQPDKPNITTTEE